jgi:hypothetical protein
LNSFASIMLVVVALHGCPEIQEFVWLSVWERACQGVCVALRRSEPIPLTRVERLFRLGHRRVVLVFNEFQGGRQGAWKWFLFQLLGFNFNSVWGLDPNHFYY